MRLRRLHILLVGLLLGFVLAPMLWFGLATGTTAQSLPFTPTPEPTDPPTAYPAPATATATALPTATPEPPTPIVLVATPTPAPTTPAPTATALPPGYGRDRCDPNHSLQQPCSVPTEADVADLSFVDGPLDVFAAYLKGGRQYRISATVKDGAIDPSIAVFLATQIDRPLATNDDARIGDPSAVVTLTVEADAYYLIQLQNTAQADPRGHTYTLSARSIGPSGAANATANATDVDDPVGNAYDVAHAARIAWGVPYDLTFHCPDPRPNACYAGRHTFLLVPIKRGVPLVATTYDLGAGVDPVLTLYRPDATQTADAPGQIPGWRAVVSNDDVVAGWTMRAQLLLANPDWSGVGLLIVAPSERADLPLLPSDGRPGRYRLIVGSPALPAVKQVLTAQDDLPPPPPTATPRPTGQAAPAAVNTQPAQDNREVIKEACATGSAVVGKETALYAAAPPGANDQIASYPPGALVTLKGECYRGWVKAQPQDSVTPGWMWGADLRPEALDATPAATGAPGSTPSADSGPARTPGTQRPTSPAGAGAATPAPGTPFAPPAATALPVPTLESLEPEPLDPPATAQPAARAVTVEVCQAPSGSTSCATPLTGLRIALVLSATRQQLTDGVTDAQGRVTLSVSVPVGSQILLSIPALGLETAIGETVTDLPVRVPQGGAS